MKDSDALSKEQLRQLLLLVLNDLADDLGRLPALPAPRESEDCEPETPIKER